MGYDMYWSQPPEGETEAVEAARKEFYVACNERDALPDNERGTWDRETDASIGQSERYAAAQARVDALSDEMDRAHASYFRLNIRGMGRYRSLMYEIGMIFDDDPVPAWPELADSGISEDDWEQWKYEDRAKVPADVAERCAKFDAEHQKVLDFHGRTDTPGIPARKFSSNDSWHVLPAECTAALRIYADKLEQWGADKMHALIAEHTNEPAYWAQWLAWLAGAARHGGFEVR